MSSLRKIEVFRNDEWITVRMHEVKKDEIFKIYEDGKLFEGCEWKALSDGYIFLDNGVGAINAIEHIPDQS